MPPPAVPASAPPVPVPVPRRRAAGRAGRSDEALARRAGAGDADAFGVLYVRYAARLEAYCRSIVRHDEDARDAVQTAMTKRSSPCAARTATSSCARGCTGSPTTRR
jgi:hypothetical protein